MWLSGRSNKTSRCSGGEIWDGSSLFEEAPDEIAILRWLQTRLVNAWRGSPTRNRLHLGAGDRTRNCFVRKSRTQSSFSVRLEMGPAFVCRGSPTRNLHAPVASAGTGDVLARKIHAKSPFSGCLKRMPKSDVRGRPRRKCNSPAAPPLSTMTRLRRAPGGVWLITTRLVVARHM